MLWHLINCRIIIIINLDNVNGAIIMTQTILRVHLVHLMYQVCRTVPSDCWLSDQANYLGYKPVGCIYIYIRHLLLLSLKEDINFTVPRMAEGWVNLGTQMWESSNLPKVFTQQRPEGSQTHIYKIVVQCSTSCATMPPIMVSFTAKSETTAT